MKIVFACCLCVFAVCCVYERAQSAEPAGEGTQRPTKLDREVRVTLQYLLFLPQGYEKQESWPLMLFLHGAGERGEDLKLVKKHGPPKIVGNKKDFPFILVSPQCELERWWNPVALTALLDEIVETYNVDEDRIYVTGLSMGGFGTWALAAHTPGRFAAIAPICGGGEVFMARTIHHIPAWVFHGAKDSVVPLRRSEEMVAALRERGAEVKLTVYPEARHDSWTETYDNSEFYDWLLQQKRKAETKEP